MMIAIMSVYLVLLFVLVRLGIVAFNCSGRCRRSSSCCF
jgi:hypothetical protein